MWQQRTKNKSCEIFGRYIRDEIKQTNLKTRSFARKHEENHKQFNPKTKNIPLGFISLKFTSDKGTNFHIENIIKIKTKTIPIVTEMHRIIIQKKTQIKGMTKPKLDVLNHSVRAKYLGKINSKLS